MIGSIFDILFDAVIGLVNIILLPIDLLISSNLPSVSNLIGYVNSFIDILINNIAWAVDSLCLPQPIIVIITDYLIFKLTFPYLLWFIKLAIKWWNNLKV